MRRRAFLSRSITTMLGASASLVRPARAGDAVSSRDDRELLPIVDTHQHLWDLGKFRLPWLDSSKTLQRNFLTPEYLEATRGLNISKAVYMEVAVTSEQIPSEAECIIELCRSVKHPTCAAVIGGRPAEEGFEDHVRRFSRSPHVKGVRQVLFSNPTLCLTERYVRSVRFLGELGLSFDLCLPPENLSDAEKLVSACPDTRFIVDHCGNADPRAFAPLRKRRGPRQGEALHDPNRWRRDMERLARHKNTVCKISGIVARAPRGSWEPGDLAPLVDHSIAAFGPDRVMFGSDWPVCTRVASLRQWVMALRRIVRSRGRDFERRLFHDNAVRFYGLE